MDVLRQIDLDRFQAAVRVQHYHKEIVEAWEYSSKQGVVRIQELESDYWIYFVEIENVTNSEDRRNLAKKLKERKPNQIPVVYVFPDGIALAGLPSFEGM